MLDDILNAEYSQVEAAAGVGHPNFSDFRRNGQREKMFVIPHITRRTYSYAAVLEMAVFMAVTEAFSRETGRGVNGALFRELMARALATKNEELTAAWEMLDARAADMLAEAGEAAGTNDDTSGGENHLARRIDLYGNAVFAPSLLLGEDAISRDRLKPTMAIFVPSVVARNTHGLRIVDTREADLSITRCRDIAVELATAGASKQDTYFFAESAMAPGLIDLTEVCLRMEEKLSLRLRARSIGRKN